MDHGLVALGNVGLELLLGGPEAGPAQQVGHQGRFVLSGGVFRQCGFDHVAAPLSEYVPLARERPRERSIAGSVPWIESGHVR